MLFYNQVHLQLHHHLIILINFFIKILKFMMFSNLEQHTYLILSHLFIHLKIMEES